MFWIVVLVVAGLAIANAGDAAPTAYVADDECRNVDIGSLELAAELAISMAKEKGWTGAPESPAEIESRMLAMIRRSLPKCVDATPETFAGDPWEDVIASAWQIQNAGAGGLEGAAPTPTWLEVVLEGVSTDPPWGQAYFIPGTIPQPDPGTTPNAGGTWSPVGED